MSRQNKVFWGALIAATMLLISSQSSLAAVRCETQYGGGEVCVRTGELQIDKEICNPPLLDDKYKDCDSATDEFIDNFGIDGRRFWSNEEVVFKLKVKNVGDDTIFNIKVTDTLPAYLFFTGGSESSYSIDKLNPGESWEKIITTRVVAESQLPKEQSLVCVVNTGEVENGDEHDRIRPKFVSVKKS